jgi:hypothetical protein
MNGEIVATGTYAQVIHEPGRLNGNQRYRCM